MQLVNSAALGEINQVRDLLAAGISPDCCPGDQLPALAQAAFNGWTEVVRLLLDAGASTGRIGYATALHRALEGGEPDCANLLLDRGADPRIPDSNGTSPAHAMLSGYFRHGDAPGGEEGACTLLSRLLDGGVRPNQCGNGRSLLRNAIESSCPRSLLDVLASRGARLSQRDADGQEPIHAAAEHGNATATAFLLERGVDANDEDAAGMTAIHWAEDPDVAEMLLRHGANIDSQDNWGRTALANHLRDLKKDQSLAPIALLISHGASLDIPDADGETARQVIVRKRLKEVQTVVAAHEARSVMRGVGRRRGPGT